MEFQLIGNKNVFGFSWRLGVLGVIFCLAGISSAEILTPSPTPNSSFLISNLSFTPTPSSTPTSSPTLTPSPTPTLTGTLQPTSTPTSTPTLTPTITFTPTMTITFTPTYTSTPGVFLFKVSPKPEPEGKIKFSWGTTVPADEAFLKIYTSGMRVVREFYFNKNENQDYLPAGLHELSWDGRDENNRPMPPGNYLCFIDIKSGLKKYESIGKTEIP